MATIEAIERIARNRTIRGGRPIIAGTTITVADIATNKVSLMQSAEVIAGWYDITLPQVYTASAFYYAYKAEIDATIIERRDAWARTSNSFV